MKTRTLGVDVITPREGYYLTQKNVDEGSRSFSEEVWLSTYDSADNWIEVDQDFKDAWEAEHPTDQIPRTLSQMKNVKCMELDNFDKSPEVNIFTVNGTDLWIDQKTRAAILNRLQAEEMIGKTETTLWSTNNYNLTVNIEKCRNMIYQLELYASQCYDVTERHRSNINSLTTKEEVDNYDFKTGYPEKLVFNSEESQS